MLHDLDCPTHTDPHIARVVLDAANEASHQNSTEVGFLLLRQCFLELLGSFDRRPDITTDPLTPRGYHQAEKQRMTTNRRNTISESL